MPSPAFMVTNLDASNYPSIKLPGASGTNRKESLLFDRILCDVPCSGDGTIRKNIGIWKSWQPNDGNGLHGYAKFFLMNALGCSSRADTQIAIAHPSACDEDA